MKHLTSLLAVSVLLLLPAMLPAQTNLDGVKWQDMELDCSSLTGQNHPRLFLTDSDVRSLKKSLAKNPNLASIHSIMMEIADGLVENGDTLQYKKDEAGRSILKVSAETVRRVVCLSYAYRITGSRQYLRKAEWYINTVCDFPDWSPEHFLDPSEMSFAVSIGYDWLYASLSEETKAKAVQRLRDYAMEEAAHGIGQHIFQRSGNWNQVCIASMTAASIATYEHNPELSYEIIRRGIEGNFRAAKEIYSPSGAFPEGPGYWEYGTCYQAYLNMMLEDTFGTDFGLSDIEGFSQTGRYKAFSRSGAGHVFNYSDNSDTIVASPGLWYMAWKFNNPGLLYDEIGILEARKSYLKERRLLVPLISAYRMGKVKVTCPDDRLYVGVGTNHVLMAKTSWDKDGLYLGLKGGAASVGHSHMDAGSFVFDAYGTRWANDYYVRAYDKQILTFRQLGLDKSQYAYDQDSYRWYLFQYNNRQHSTLTVNGKNHNADGFASLVGTWDEKDRLGGRLDLTDVFVPDLKSAYRSASIVNSEYLEIVDELAAPDSSKAIVRFTLISKVKPVMVDDGIIFNDGKTKMKLSTDAPGAVFRTWSSNPKDYDSPTAFGEPSFRKTWICGYEYELQPSQSAKITTTLKKK